MKIVTRKDIKPKQKGQIIYARVKAETKKILTDVARKEGFGDRLGQLLDAIAQNLK